MDDAAFIRTIIDNHDDDGPRLVYADWLEERGECARAEFIKVQCEQARLEATLPKLLFAFRIDVDVGGVDATKYAIGEEIFHAPGLTLGPTAIAYATRAGQPTHIGEMVDAAQAGRWFRGQVMRRSFDFGEDIEAITLRLDSCGEGQPPGRAEVTRLFERAGELLRQHRDKWEEPIQPAGPARIAKSHVGGGLGLAHSGTHLRCTNHTGDDAVVEIRDRRGLQSQFFVRGQATLEVPLFMPLFCGDLITMGTPSAVIYLRVGDRFDCSWRRGFVEGVTCTRRCWSEYWAPIYDVMPLRSVCLTDLTIRDLALLEQLRFRAPWGRIRDWPTSGGFMVPMEFANTALVNVGVYDDFTNTEAQVVPLASSPSP